MRNLVRIVCGLGIFVTAAGAANPCPQSTPQRGTSIVITFKDGHQQSFMMEEIARIEYTDPASSTLGPDPFLGKWEAGDGSSGTFVIAFETNGEAAKSIGASHGIWTVAGDEARTSWDDGWHDVIRKAGEKHEKFAFAPGVAFDGKPDNVTDAHKVDSKP